MAKYQQAQGARAFFYRLTRKGDNIDSLRRRASTSNFPAWNGRGNIIVHETLATFRSPDPADNKEYLAVALITQLNEHNEPIAQLPDGYHWSEPKNLIQVLIGKSKAKDFETNGPDGPVRDPLPPHPEQAPALPQDVAALPEEQIPVKRGPGRPRKNPELN